MPPKHKISSFLKSNIKKVQLRPAIHAEARVGAHFGSSKKPLPIRGTKPPVSGVATLARIREQQKSKGKKK